MNRLEAERVLTEAATLAKPPARLVRGSGEAVAPEPLPAASRTDVIIDTLEHPDMVHLAASEQRVEDAFDAHVLESALDASVSAQARNSLEKMLCHQLAGAHHAAMRL